MLAVAPVQGDEITSFVRTYCVSCHGETKQKAERRFDRVDVSVLDESTLIDLQDIADQLTLGEMPPKSAKQPPSDAVRQVIDQLTVAIGRGHEALASTGGRAVLRRLNRDEYLNTIRDLLGINMTMFDPTTKFPRDQTVEHLDNVGDTLVMSSHLLMQYLSAADEVIEKAFACETRLPERTWQFKGRFHQQPELDKAQQHAFENRFLCLYECPQSERPEGAIAPLLDFPKGVPVDGLYELRVHAAALNRLTPYDAKLLGTDPSEPLRLGVIPGNAKLGTMHLHQPFGSVLAEVPLADAMPQWHTFTIWLDAGFSPRFIFPNGVIDIRGLYRPLVTKYEELYSPKFQRASGIVEHRIALFSEGKMPHIRIDEVQIRGPLADSPMTPVQRIVSDVLLDDTPIPKLLSDFASTAFRRPLRVGEIDRLQQFYVNQVSAGRSAQDAFRHTLKSILCSTSFLYIEPETVDGADGQPAMLTPHALANRLSYFLWSSMPDDELRRFADDGTLLQTDVLRSQTRRMLADAKSDAFVVRFLDSWLNLRSLGDMPPDRGNFESYYSHGLRDAMRRETFLFARDLIDQNQSILRFISADYGFVNRSLAKLYDIADKVPATDGHQFRRVTFADARRGGLLGQGSVLTVSANGVETSPVIRGVWLLENLLGTPPAPPPDDVPAIDPDVRGARSIRDRLAKHRTSPACNECHQKIDPLGFALENFDPIGQWRDEYENGGSIDSSGQLPGVDAFAGVTGLKQVLLEREALFARLLTEKLLAYGCGRRIEPLDRPQVDRIVAAVRNEKYPLRTLIECVVASELFRSQ